MTLPIPAQPYTSLLTGSVYAVANPVATTFQTELVVATQFRPDANSALVYLMQHQQRLLLKLLTIGPQSQQKLLEAKLKRPVPMPTATQKLLTIVQDPSLSREQKKQGIEALRQELGLSRKQMRTLFTGRVEKIYAASIRELRSYRKQTLAQMKQQLSELKQEHGSKHPEVVSFEAEIKQVETHFRERLQPLEDTRSLLGGLYGGKSCIKRTFGAIGSAFKKVGSVLTNVIKWSPLGLAARIPGIKTFLSPVLIAGRKLIKTLSRPFELVKKVVTGVKSFIQNPLRAVKQGLNWAGRFIKNNWRWLTPLALNAIPYVGPALARIARPVLRAYSLSKAVYQQGKKLYHNIKDWIAEPWQKFKQTAVSTLHTLLD